MTNQKLELARQRSQLTKKIREFFEQQNFTEVETPIMVEIPGMEPYLTPFETSFTPPFGQSHTIATLQTTTNPTPHHSPIHNTSTTTHPKIPIYLNTSPELQMKKLLGQGFGNIFQICKVFRNGETGGPLHNPEFTMLEWYRENADYKDLMTDCENLITHLTKTISDQSFTNSGDSQHGTNISQAPVPWPRKSINELFIEHCNIDLDKNHTAKELKSAAAKQNLDTTSCEEWDDIFFKIFLNHIEPKLPKGPIFIYDYPATQAALARKSPKNPFFAERFELYINGIELANAFSELLDSNEQRQRLIEDQNFRKKLQKTVFPIDEEFLTALESIHQPCAGIALGLDRLFMLLLNKKSIEEVLLFPFRT